MSNIKTYNVKATWYIDAELTLRVDHDILTPELATEINNFWSENGWRLSKEDGDVVRAVIRMFGARALRRAMEQGWDFSNHSGARALNHAEDVINMDGEGWPNAEGLGISITDASASLPDFDDVELEAA